MNTQKKVTPSNTTTFITGSFGKFIPAIKYDSKIDLYWKLKGLGDPGLMNIIDLKNLTKEPNRALDCVFNDTGEAFASIDSTGHLIVYYLLKNRFINVCKDVFPTAFCFTEKKEGLIFLALPNKVIKVCNLAGKQLYELKGHKNTINGMKVSHSRNLLLSHSHDACILWDLTTFKIYRTFHSVRFGYCSATFAPDGDSLIAFTQDSVITFFSICNSEVIRKVLVPSGSNLKKLAISVESRYLVAGGNCPFLYVFDLSGNDDYLAFQLPSGCETIKDLKFFEKNRLVVLGGDNQIYCVDFQKDKSIVLTKNITGKAIISFDVDLHGKNLLTVVNSGEIYLHDFAKLLTNQEKARNETLNKVPTQDIGYSTLKLCDTSDLLKETASLSKKKSRTTAKKSTTNRTSSLRGPFQDKNDAGLTLGSDTFARDQGDTILMGKLGQNTGEGNLTKTNFPGKENFAETSKTLKTLYQTAKLDVTKSRLNKPELESFLTKFQVFPEKHRTFIWRTLLDLPLNNEAFDNLVAKGTHMAFQNLQNEYPLISVRLLTKLQRILSCLAHYCSVFAEVEFLPDLIFPFVKLFANEEIVCFEAILSFFMQWGQHYLEFHPGPPSSLIQAAEELLKYHDYELFSHLKEKRVNIRHLIWLFLHNVFTDILTKQDWLSLMDFMVLNCHDPLYILFFIVSYLSHLKPSLLNAEELNIEYFIKKQSSLHMPAIIEKMKEYSQMTDSSVLSIAFKDNLPMEGKQYPFFEFYPKFSLEQRMKIKEEILKEDQRRYTQQQQNREINRLSEEILLQEEKLKEKKEILSRAEIDRRDLKSYEEDMRLQQKLNLERDSRERRAIQLKTLEETIKDSLNQQEKVRQTGLKELQQDLQMKSKIDNHMIQSQLEEEALRNLEFQTIQKLNEIVEARNREEKAREMRTVVEQKEKQTKLKEIAYRDTLQKEEEENRLRMELLRKQKMMEQSLQQESEKQKELTYKIMMEEFERDSKLKDLERETKLRRIIEEGRTDEDELRRLNEKHERALREEEENQIRKILDEERKLTLTRANERLMMLEQERRFQKSESLNARDFQRTGDLPNQTNDFEERLLELRKESHLREIEEERKLNNEILELEKENRAKKQELQDYDLKQKELEEKEAYLREVRANEERIKQEEYEKFRQFQKTFTNQFSRIDESQSKFGESRSYEASGYRNDTMTQQTDDIRDSAEKNDQRYFEETQRSEDPRHDQYERSQETRSNVFRSQEVRIEDQGRREDGQRTGTFQSPNSSKRNFGQSVSFYTYSDTANEDNGRRFESTSRGNHNSNESEQMSYKQQYSHPDNRQYYAEGRQPYGSTEDYQKRQDEDNNYGSDEKSPERYYQAGSGSSRGHTLQSSPDLTYSSYEGSAQKGGVPYGYEEN